MAYPNTYEESLKLMGNPPKSVKIADLGCGKGFVVQMLHKKGYQNVTYCDIEDKFDGKVKIVDLNKKIPFKDNSFDIVIATEVIEHLENKYLFFRETARILKPRGILIFSTPNIANLPNRLLYLLTGRFIEFHKGLFHEHINAYFSWEIPKFFKKEKVSYNRGFIPILRMPAPKNRLFGQTIITKCRKI